MFGKKRQARRDFERDMREAEEEFLDESCKYTTDAVSCAIAETYRLATGRDIEVKAAAKIANAALVYASGEFRKRQAAKAEMAAWLGTVEETR